LAQVSAAATMRWWPIGVPIGHDSLGQALGLVLVQRQMALSSNASTAWSGSLLWSGVSAMVTCRFPSSVANDQAWYASASPSLP
jgi:hypothetical protein